MRSYFPRHKITLLMLGLFTCIFIFVILIMYQVTAPVMSIRKHDDKGKKIPTSRLGMKDHPPMEQPGLNKGEENEQNVKTISQYSMLVLFSTWIKKPGKEHVQKSILGTWRNWYPSIRPVLFTDDLEIKQEAEGYHWDVRNVQETGCGNVSLPTLRGMFKVTMSEFNNTSMLFGFSNGDLLFDDGLQATLNTFVMSEAYAIYYRPVMILVRRVSVNVNDNVTYTNVSQVQHLAKEGRYSSEGSSDVFITNRHFPWNDVPEIVIGRDSFGMWIVAFARANNAIVYDVTKTVTAVHMTTKEGIFKSSKTTDAWCNNHTIDGKKVRPKSYLCGYIECADKRSVYSVDGEVVFTSVDRRSKMKGCEICDL